jgi:hypothetical protein
MNIIRVYPIRTTRSKWRIPLFNTHKCGENCNIDTAISNNLNKCLKNNMLEKTRIQISTFNINEPCISNNTMLVNINTKVIPDNFFKIFLYYPLSHLFEVLIETPSSNGFTLKELLHSIKTLYEFIYTEEERTSIPQNYRLKKMCTSCGNRNLSKYVNNVTDKSIIKDKCCICYSDYENEINNEPVILKCSHIFHDNCIKEWLQKSGTCPICRSNIFECENCDGNGIIYYNFTGVVIPLDQRGDIQTRNQTFGVFGIHSHDLEDLFIKNLFYDKTKKQLFIEIISR